MREEEGGAEKANESDRQTDRQTAGHIIRNIVVNLRCFENKNNTKQTSIRII